MSHVYDAKKLDFIEATDVLARLTYKADGEPIALLGGRKRDRERDMGLLQAWLRAMFLRTDRKTDEVSR